MGGLATCKGCRLGWAGLVGAGERNDRGVGLGCMEMGKGAGTEGFHVWFQGTRW